jgi:hypothetical protein
MSNAIALRPEQQVPVSMADIEKMASAVAKSGLFGVKTPDQAMALMLIAHAEGMHPAIAARDYDIIQGRPAKKAEAMMRDFMRGGGKVEWKELTDLAAEATFSHPAGGSIPIRWDIERANKAGLGSKDMWKKFPRQMLRSRCISEGVRTVFPMATSGMYAVEEVQDFDDRPLKDVTPKPAAPSTGAQAKLDALAGETPNASPAPKPQATATLYTLDPMDGSDPAELTGVDWLARAEIALNSHEQPASFWKANEKTFYAIQEAATVAGARKAVTQCSRLADLAHSMLSE